MKVVIDVEANGLENANKIWCIVCKDIDTGQVYVCRSKEDFEVLYPKIKLYIGHNILGYDIDTISKIYAIKIDSKLCLDTLIISKLVNYSRNSHSVEDYGLEFNYPKIDFNDFSKYSEELEIYCIRDVEIAHKIYLKYLKIIKDPKWYKSIILEHKFQLLVNSLHDNGFSFNTDKAKKLLDRVTNELAVLDKDILEAFKPKLKLIKEIHPKETKHGTLSKSDFRFVKDGDLSEYNGGPFCRCVWDAFNPSSHKQIISVLNAAQWVPVDKTQTHIDTERELNRLRYSFRTKTEVDLAAQSVIMGRLEDLRKTGWKVNENNLSTLPPSAPTPARLLAKRILLESRRRTLTEWLSLVRDDGRIHGQFYGIGAWTHRMAHQKPNTANIPSEFREDGSPKLLGREMRQLWRAPRNRLLVGVDAEGIQLRIFAHYINDPEFTDALVRGRKSEKTDPHSLNQRILGSVCKTRQAAKRFVYALLLGGGMAKLAQVLDASESDAREALDRLLERYTGFAELKRSVIPKDAERGYFEGLDGRRVPIPGDTVSQRKHLCMSGYLQNGEAICMKSAAILWHEDPDLLDIAKEYPWLFVDMVHDEWQTEVVNNMKIALRIAEIQSNSLKLVGEELGLRCPLAGSYFNDDHQDYTIGTNWYSTH